MPDSQKIIENPSRFDSGITERRQNNSIVKRGSKSEKFQTRIPSTGSGCVLNKQRELLILAETVFGVLCRLHNRCWLRRE